MTLRTKTSLLMAIFITVALGMSGLFYLNFLKNALRNSIFEGLTSVSVTSSEAVSRFLETCSRDAQAVAFALPVEALERRDAAAIEEKFKALLKVFPNFENGMFILDAQGRLWVDYPVNLGVREKSYAFREYFQRTLKEGKGIIGVPYISSRINEPVLTFTALLRDSSNEIIGVLGCSVRLFSARTSQVMRSTKIGKSGYIYVFDKSRLMILHPDNERVLQRDVPLRVNRLFDAAIEEGFEGVGETVNSRGIPMLAAVSLVSGSDWILVAQQPMEEAYAPIRKATSNILWGLSVAIAAAVLMTALIVRRVTEPIVKLRDAVLRFKYTGVGEETDADWKAEPPVRGFSGAFGRDEIGDLASAFKDMAEKLRETLSSLKSAAVDWENTFDSVPDAIFLIDHDHRILRINRAAAALLDAEPDKAVGQPCYRLVHKTESPPAYCPHLETMATGKLASREIEDPCTERFLRMMTTPLRDGAGKTTGSIHVTRDITERKRVERTLQRTKDMLEALIQGAPVAINVVDSSGKILMWNPASEEIFGWREEEVLGRFHPLIPDEKRGEFTEMLNSTFEGKILRNVETRRRKKDGILIDVSVSTAPVHDASGRVIGAIGILLDMTEHKRAEEERTRLEAHLRQAYKMEAIGTLAGGIAHDFNNILGAILGYTELSLHEVQPGSRLESNLDHVLKAGLRAKDLVKQILAFSRQSETEARAIQVSPIVKEALKLLRASLPATIEIKEEIGPGLGAVMADPTQIHQVLMNLCTNAAHAMREKGGTLQVSLNRIASGPAAMPGNPGPGTSPYLRLTVRDTGHGMDKQTMERIFDPYFTTKDKGVGTGLGLAVVQGIVKSCGGEIHVESETGIGTTFHVFLPLVDQGAGARSEASEALPTGNAHILFVDDEGVLADLGKQMLEHLGYEVTTRTSSIDALEAFKANPEKFDLVITDTTMPHMTGVDLAEEMLRIRSDIRIILCTGFSEVVTPEQVKAMGIRELLMKPLAMGELSRAIHRVLNEDSVGGT